MLSAFAQSTLPVASSGNTAYSSNVKVGKYADIRGFKMYYEVYGTGKPVLIIHDNGGSIKDFRHQIPYFAKNYQVILADSLFRLSKRKRKPPVIDSQETD